jgi:hypothetical protein
MLINALFKSLFLRSLLQSPPLLMQLRSPIRGGPSPSSFLFRPVEIPTLSSGTLRIDCRFLSTSLSLSKIVRAAPVERSA